MTGPRLALLTLVMVAVGSAAAAEQQIRLCDPLRVVDGDTIVCIVSGTRERVRVVGVDTPEMRARCERERSLADAATREVWSLIYAAGARVMLIGDPARRDRYGRLLARVEIAAPDHDRGEDLAGHLLAAGLGRPYAGGKRDGWCK